LELGVLADVRRHHLPDHLLAEEDAEPPVVDAAVVRDAGQVSHVAVGERENEVLGDAAEPEASDDERGAGGDVRDRLRRRLAVRRAADDLVDHRAANLAREKPRSGYGRLAIRPSDRKNRSPRRRPWTTNSSMSSSTSSGECRRASRL